MRLRLPGASITLITAAILTAAPAAAAHDFWLVPSTFLVEPGGVLEVRGQTSSRFPTSEAAVSLDRIAQAQLIDAEGAHPLTDLGRVGQSLLIRERPRTAGQKIVAVALHPRSVRESAEGFRRYLVLEGAPEAAERYERTGLLPSDSVRLIFGGEPLAGVRVHAGGVPMEPGLDDEAAAVAAQTLEVETDAAGVARIPIGREALWNVRTLHIVPAEPGSGADWDTHWASLVFGVGTTADHSVSSPHSRELDS
jgi:uncharacterized GH25 family protein